MKYSPHDYQSFVTDWIINKTGSAIFLDMGMGKTVCTLTAIYELMYNCFDVSRVLVIAPLRVAQDTWSSEVEKWEHLKNLRISKILGSERDRIRAIQNRADIYITNRENVEWLVDWCGLNWNFDMVVIDELSSFKSPASKRFRALRKVRPLIKRVVGLTGTPAPNGLMDLWSEIYLIDRGERLGATLREYRERYFQKIGGCFYTSYKPKPGSDRAVYERLSDICVSMKSCDYLKLPERVENVVRVRLPESSLKMYRELERDMLLKLQDTSILASTAAVLASKLLQMANGTVYDELGNPRVLHSAKLKALEDIVEASNGKPLLVFYSYRHDLERLLEHFQKHKCRVLDSQEDIENWNKGNIPIMFLHPASSGHGLNLQTGGSTIVWYGLTWSLELYQQANVRLYRQGQKNTVVIHHLVAKDTIDEAVMKALERKEAGQEALFKALKGRVNFIYGPHQ